MTERCASEKQLIRENRIEDELDNFRSSFKAVCGRRSIPSSAASVELLNSEGLHALLGNKTIRNDILRLISTVASGDFDFGRITPLLKAALADTPDDALVWELASSATAESTPPRSIAVSIQETPWSQNTSGIIYSSELRQSVDSALKLELEHLFTGLPLFHEAFFADVPELNTVADIVFRKCLEGDNPLFKEGWSGWPVLADEANSHILVPGELKSNPKADTASAAWIDLARYAREVFAAQATRRFVLGFTLCGSRMRVWEFDRLGGIASEPFDINNHHGGRQFVATILAFLRMDEEMLGFDPTIKLCDGQPYIEIKRNNKIERLIIEEVMKRTLGSTLIETKKANFYETRRRKV
ncbi:hypothetical protein ARSEF4850_009525 [Beauveria asiatica]